MTKSLMQAALVITKKLFLMYKKNIHRGKINKILCLTLFNY